MICHKSHIQVFNKEDLYNQYTHIFNYFVLPINDIHKLYEPIMLLGNIENQFIW